MGTEENVVRPRAARYLPAAYLVDLEEDTDLGGIIDDPSGAQTPAAVNRWNQRPAISLQLTEETAAEVTAAVNRQYGVNTTTISSYRGQTRTVASMHLKNLKKYDRKARKCGFDSYEARFDGDELFRQNMLLKGYDRDFRTVCETKWKYETGMAFGKTGKARALREQAQQSAKGGKQFPSPYSGAADRSGGKGWGQRSGKGSTWTGAAVWAGSTWTASGHKMTVYKDGAMTVKREEIPGSIYFYYLQMLFYIILFGFTVAFIIYTYVKIRKFFKWAKGFFNTYQPSRFVQSGFKPRPPTPANGSRLTRTGSAGLGRSRSSCTNMIRERTSEPAGFTSLHRC